MSLYVNACIVILYIIFLYVQVNDIPVVGPAKSIFFFRINVEVIRNNKLFITEINYE